MMKQPAYAEEVSFMYNTNLQWTVLTAYSVLEQRLMGKSCMQ